MIRTYTYKLYSNKRVETKFNNWLNVTRYVYNIAKETKETAYKEGVNLTGFDLQKQLTEAKREVAWVDDVNAQTLQSVITQLDISYKNFFSGRTKYPKWASTKTWMSFEFKQSGVRVTSPKGYLRQTDKGFKLPKFGEVKVFNNRVIDGKIKTARLIKKADGIYLHVVAEAEAEAEDKVYCTNENQVGIDMGIKYFCVTSDGEFIDNPRFLNKQLKMLRVEHRKLSRKFQKGVKVQSKNYYKQVKVLAKLHKKVVDARKDFLHKQSIYFAANYSDIAIEDLKITKMVKGVFSKHISDVSWGAFFYMLEYKANNLVRVNPAYTSQECSKCGYTCKENRVTQSIFKCISCGHEDNADVDAAKVILGRAFPNSRERSTLVQALAVESHLI